MTIPGTSDTQIYPDVLCPADFLQVLLQQPFGGRPTMDDFFARPILNSPYECPTRHWELDAQGQPTQQIIESRRKASFVTPIPRPRKRRAEQGEIDFDDGTGVSTSAQKYDPTSMINEVRGYVARWRVLPPAGWGVSPHTARLLQHWRHHPFSAQRPFFCQIEAVETAIWLSEVMHQTEAGKRIQEYLQQANQDANPELFRIALKLATGAGKTTVMAMLIAWQTINAVHQPQSKKFSRGFLIVSPGLTIRDRLRVLQPSDPDNYYATRELVPPEMIEDVRRAKIVITNYHAFKLRERLEVSAVSRALLEGRGEPIQTKENEGNMIQRVMPALQGMKNIIVINDEAHHCYREKPDDDDDEIADLSGDEKDEAKKNNEAARLWITGIEWVKKKLGVTCVYDLSATPFFLRGSGYVEGSLFPWTVCDFSLMDAIEAGIVKLPRVPVADNVPGSEMPMFRNLWDNVRTDMPRKGRGKAVDLDPLQLPIRLKTALEALYGHYVKEFRRWRDAGLGVPPCFIVVCQNTAVSKLVYDYISGFYRQKPDGTSELIQGRLELFRNFDDNTGDPLPRPNTLLIDSEQLESGDVLDSHFRAMAAPEIEQFRRDRVERSGNQLDAEVSDQDLLREVMNTVGKAGQLGGGIRCVVSVSMLTEGWDANTVTHILGLRAFGTQLLCEQVIGRALRRRSYDLNVEGKFDVEYADVFGIPFDFNAKPTLVGPPTTGPRETIQVRAVSPDRDALEICFPRVEGYRVELPNVRLEATFGPDSVLELTPDLIGASQTVNSGIIGEAVNMTLEHLNDLRQSSVIYHLAHRLLETKLREPGEASNLNLFPDARRIVRDWLDRCLVCKGGTFPAQLMYQELSDMACSRIVAGITQRFLDERPIKAILDPYNPTGSTRHVRFNTSRIERWQTAPNKCHLNWIILESDWEAEFCRVAEAHPKVLAYVKNYNLGLEVPYQFGSESRKYRPDFIVLVDDGQGMTNPLHLIIEIKGYRREDAKEKKLAMDTYWVPGVNRLGTHGRWAFAEFTDVYEIEENFRAKIDAELTRLIDQMSHPT